MVRRQPAVPTSNQEPVVGQGVPMIPPAQQNRVRVKYGTQEEGNRNADERDENGQRWLICYGSKLFSR